MLATLLFALFAQDPGPMDAAPFEDEATLEACLTREDARDHSPCWPLLEAEVALAPDGLFNTAHETSPGRLEGWLGVVCAPERLDAGQTDAECRTQAQARLERSRAARRVMGPATTAADAARYQRLRDAVSAELARREAPEADPFDTGVDVEAGFRIDPRAQTGLRSRPKKIANRRRSCR